MLASILWCFAGLLVVGAAIGYVLSIRLIGRDVAVTVVGCGMSTVVLILAAMFAYLAIGEAGPTFELRKDEWHCAESHEEVVPTVQSASGGTTVVPQIDTVCDRYDRVEG
jgi:hypothetical protein